MADFTVGDYDYTIVSGTTNVSMKVHDTSKTSYATPTGTVTYDGVTYTVTDMYRCFYNCKSLVTAPSLSAMTSVTRMQQCFYYCTAMTSGPNLSGMVSVTNMTDCFEYCKAMTTPPNLSGMSSVTDMSGCFALCTVMSSPPDLSSMTQVTDLFQCFCDCDSLASPPDISHMTLVTDMKYCFKNCKAMTSPPNLSNLTLVTRMDSCFEKCTSLTVPPDMSAMTALTRMDSCFSGCTALASPPNLSNCTLMTNMSQAFHSCTSLSNPPDLSGMTLVTDMSLCFYGCTALKVAPNMSNMIGLQNALSCFRNCTSIGGFVNIGTTYTGSYPSLSVNYIFDGTSRTLILVVPPSMRSSWEARTLPANVSLIGTSVSNVSVDIGDYRYKYYTDSEGTLTSLYAKVIDTTKTSYEPICPLVTSLDECFYGCSSMTAPPSMHGMTLVTNMFKCFRGCTSMSSSPDLSSMSGLESMNYCFYGCSSMVSPPNLSGISSVELMDNCFYGCTSMTSPPDMSSMTEVIDMYECFYNCSSMTSPPDLSGLGPYVSISYCFYNCSSMTSPPDMSGLTETRSLQRCFYGCSVMTSPPDLSQMVLVDTMSYCFYNCSSMLTPPDLSNMTRVTSMEGCFSGCSSMATPPDISGMTQLLNLTSCFQNCTAMAYVPDLSNLESVTSLASCFTMCTSITSPPDLSNMSLVTNMYRCFSGCSALTSPPDLSSMALVDNMSYCFYGCTSMTTPPDLSAMAVATNMSYCFAGCSVMTSAPNLSGMSSVTNMSYCFADCTALTLGPNMSGMSSVTDISYCFSDCTALTSGPNMSGMSSVTDISYCFSDCTALTSGPNMSGMSSVTNMSHAFYQCSSMVLPPNLSGVSSVTDMSYCFYRCYRMASPPDMRFMSKVTNMESCFFYCSSLTSSPDMSGMVSVTNMSHCFDYCTALASPPDMLNMTKVTNMYMCFRYCEALTTPPDLSNMTLLTNMDECFLGCSKMLGFLAIGTATPPNNLGTYILEGVGMGTGNQGTVLDSNSPGFLHNYLVVVVPSSQRSNWSSYIGAMPHVKLVAASVTNSVLYLGWDYRSLSSSSMSGNVPKAEDTSVYRYVYSTNSSGQLTALSCYALGAPYSGSTFYSFPQIDMNTMTMSNCFDMNYHGSLTGNQKPYVDTYGKASTGLYYPYMIPPKVSVLSYAFYGCSGMEIPPVMTRVSRATTLAHCFEDCRALKFGPTIGSINSTATAIPDMTGCFAYCEAMEKFGYPYELDRDMLTPIIATGVAYCFTGCQNLEVAPSVILAPDTGRNVSVNASALAFTFASCIKLKEIAPYSGVLHGGVFGMENVSSMELAFSDCRAMTDPPKFYGGYSNATDTSIHVTSMQQTFQYCSVLSEPPDLSKFDSLQSLAFSYRLCTSLEEPPVFSDASKTTITNMASCFTGCSRLTKAADQYEMSALTNASYCYQDCVSLESAQSLDSDRSDPTGPLILKGVWSLPSNSKGMFRGCTALTGLALLAGNCENMSEIFYDCSALTTPSFIFDKDEMELRLVQGSNEPSVTYGSDVTPAVTDMSYAFYRCTSLELAPDLSGLSSVTDMNHCFSGCTALITPPVMDGMTSLANLSYAFSMCSSMTSLPDISDSTAVTNMSYCFDGCESAEGDLGVGSKLVTSYEGLFRDTEEDIWIIPTVSADRTHSADSVSTTGDHWYYVVYRDIPESLKDHVHIYSPGVNPLPTCTVEYKRFERPEDFIENQAGTWILFDVGHIQTYTVTVKEQPKLKILKAYIVDVDDLQSVAYLKEAETVVYEPGSSYHSIDLTYVCPDRTSPRYANDLSSYNVYGKYPSDIPNDVVYLFTQQDTTSKFVVVHLVDSYDNVKLVFVTVPKAFATFSFYKPGTGVGVGIPAHRNGLDVDMQGYFYNNIGVKDFATLPVVVCHDSQPDPNANYPDPCIVLCVDPTYVWAAITGMSLPSSFGIKPYLVGDNLPMTAENDDKVFVTSEPYLVGSTPTDSWKVVSSIIFGTGSKVTKFPVDNVLSKSAGSYTIVDTDAGKQLMVSVFGKDELTLTFQNGNDYDQLHGVHFEVYGMNVKDIANAEPVYSSTEDPEYNRINTEASWNANVNPSEEGWYEKDTLLVTQGSQGGGNERYVLSEDTNVVVGKDYYTQGQRKYTMKGIDGKLGFFYIDAVEDSDYYTPNVSFDYDTTSSVTF